MRLKNWYLFAFLLMCAFNSSAQTDSRLFAEEVVEKLSARTTFISPPKKDSLITVFITYYDDFMVYRSKGSKMIKALQLSRDTEVARILSVPQYEEYKAMLDEEQLAQTRKVRSKQYGRK